MSSDIPSPDATRSNQDEADRRAELPRHFITYSLFTVPREWRRLPGEVRERHGDEFSVWSNRWSERMMVRTFSMVGIRADADILIWRATPEFDLLQESMTDLFGTDFGTWLEQTYAYTSTTKQSAYRKDVASEGFEKLRPLDVQPNDSRYLIMYPFVKQRAWYGLPREERGAAMREHAVIGRRYPEIKLNTSYSFGIDDQEFMTAFETDSVHDFLDLMMELRHTKASAYTERDTPIFTARLMNPREVVASLGGARAPIAISE